MVYRPYPRRVESLTILTSTHVFISKFAEISVASLRNSYLTHL